VCMIVTCELIGEAMSKQRWLGWRGWNEVSVWSTLLQNVTVWSRITDVTTSGLESQVYW